MLELLRDSAWNFLAVVIGLVTLIAPMFQRRQKGLSYEVVYQTTLSKYLDSIFPKVNDNVHA